MSDSRYTMATHYCIVLCLVLGGKCIFVHTDIVNFNKLFLPIERAM